MKSDYQDLSYKLSEFSVSTLHFSGNDIQFHVHHHDEYEIVFINSGYGQRIIGGKVDSYSNGDFVLVNSMISHTWYPTTSSASVTVVQFSKQILNTFLTLPEFSFIIKQFKLLNTYIQFSPPNKTILSILEKTEKANGIEKVIIFIKLLNTMFKQIHSIMNITTSINYNLDQQNRINKILNYIQQNYQNELTLKNIANKHNMSVSNLCKFFKKHTTLTFSQYINRLRIHACCDKLNNTDLSISTIAYENGFNNISYFNRVFLMEMGCSPKQFRTKNSK
ncbi:AraC family transcriptional regulator [Bacteroides sp.]|uniref:AraC family transcriptional regulator n=1 Tax=Bacteroides sp. TaxID=29523 RepID=UPI002631DE1A|nr:AraC family transcriptional regulator [Bacteroides sp.]MDD3037578.1 AraC family transcriptional regulator [Bacteroides sp.]